MLGDKIGEETGKVIGYRVIPWVLGSLGNPHPRYAELLAFVARGKLRPARLVTREIALEDVNDTLDRMTRFDTVGFEVITRFTRGLRAAPDRSLHVRSGAGPSPTRLRASREQRRTDSLCHRQLDAAEGGRVTP